MEIRARDEHYSRAVLDIVVRPSIGVATYREKYLESRLRGALEPIFLASMAPRTLVQVVAQIVQVGGELALQKVTATAAANEYNPVLLLPALITTCLLALIDAGVPLSSILDTYLVTINPPTITAEKKNKDNKPNININPYSDPSLLHSAKSIHVLCHSTAVSGSSDSNAPGELVLVESEGNFSWKEWAQVDRLVRRQCMGLSAEDEDVDMDMDIDTETQWGKGLMATFVRELVGRKVVRDLRWRK